MTLAKLIGLLDVLAILVALVVRGINPVILRDRLRGVAWQLGGDLRLIGQRAVTVQQRFGLGVTNWALPVPGGATASSGTYAPWEARHE